MSSRTQSSTGYGILRAFFLLCRACLLLVVTTVEVSAEPVDFVDMAGRRVHLDAEPQRIALGDGRLLTAFALLTSEPAARVVGSTDNLKRYDLPTYRAYVSRFPQVERIADLGPANSDLSPESLLALSPDLVLLPLWLHNDRHIEETMQRAGVPVVYVDFFSDPIANLAPALRVLGAVLGRRQQAENYIAFHERHMGVIAKRLADSSPKRPTVFLHARSADWDCCWTATGKVGEMIDFAGGINIARGLMASATGQLSLEFVIGNDPDIYIAAASSAADRPGGFPLGQSVEPSRVEEALQAVRQERSFGTLTAVSEGRIHALWLFFFQSPTYVVAVEAMARWFHPELFADLDPARTLNEINTNFLAVPMQGTFFATASACGAKAC